VQRVRRRYSEKVMGGGRREEGTGGAREVMRNGDCVQLFGTRVHSR
jgi:hypothetical protein